MKKPNPPKLVTVAVTTTITVVFWIFFTLYQVITAKPDPIVDSKLLEPIVPELDQASLQQIGQRVFFEEGSFTLPDRQSSLAPSPTEVVDEPSTEEEDVPADTTPESETEVEIEDVF